MEAWPHGGITAGAADPSWLMLGTQPRLSQEGRTSCPHKDRSPCVCFKSGVGGGGRIAARYSGALWHLSISDKARLSLRRRKTKTAFSHFYSVNLKRIFIESKA